MWQSGPAQMRQSRPAQMWQSRPAQMDVGSRPRAQECISSGAFDGRSAHAAREGAEHVGEAKRRDGSRRAAGDGRDPRPRGRARRREPHAHRRAVRTAQPFRGFGRSAALGRSFANPSRHCSNDNCRLTCTKQARSTFALASTATLALAGTWRSGALRAAHARLLFCCTMCCCARPAHIYLHRARAHISSGTLCLLCVGTRSCSSRRTSTRVRCSTRPHCW
jgi:hypothetical protein